MTIENNTIETWFSERSTWIQTAAAKLIAKGDLEDKDIEELVALCKSGSGIEIPVLPGILSVPAGSLTVDEATENLCLNAIQNVSGINALKPTKPLTFGNTGLTVVYGGNGSGKSGYVRLLKHACGARHPGKLLQNVFERQNQQQQCQIAVTVGEISKPLSWKMETGPVDELRSVDIYDTHCALLYLTEENEVTYEPWALRFFSKLTRICDRVSQMIGDEIQKMPSQKPRLPDEYSDSDHGKWYSSLTEKATDDEPTGKYAWAVEDEKKNADLRARLAEGDPTEKAKKLQKQKSDIDNFVQELEAHAQCLSPESCERYISAKRFEAIEKKAASDYATSVFRDAPLEGVGSDTWRKLWNAAKRYSEEKAYKGVSFPNTQDDSRCVLCQQPLSGESRTRFQSFEEFIRGELEKNVADASAKVAELEKAITEAPDEGACELRLKAARIESEDEKKCVADFCFSLRARRASLLQVNKVDPDLPNPQLLDGLKKAAFDLEKKSSDLEKDAVSQNRIELQKEFKELECRKWVSVNRDAVMLEIDRLRTIAALEDAKRSASSTSGVLSKKKSSLAESLITPAYIERFKDELEELSASKVAVSLKQTRTEQGQVYHQIILKECCKPAGTTDVLSEGEFRIVSLAAFLADVTGRTCASPFIFDDPISSLDQEFEEATVKRLVKLASSRQVIVFTHRISLLSQLREEVEEVNGNFTTVGLWSVYGQIGEPGETPMFAKKPASAIHSLKNERLSQARRALAEDGLEAYESFAKVICRDVRITIERIVELVLIADVVQRFRRAVNTKGKIKKLAKITTNDCKFIDDLMTKYSAFEHSQPEESPVALPGPDELAQDLQNIEGWLDEFSKREVPSTSA